MLWLAEVCRPVRTLNSSNCLYAVGIDGVCCESDYGGVFTIILSWGPDVSFAVSTGGALFPNSHCGMRSTSWAASIGANVRLVLQSENGFLVFVVPQASWFLMAMYDEKLFREHFIRVQRTGTNSTVCTRSVHGKPFRVNHFVREKCVITWMSYSTTYCSRHLTLSLPI